MSQPETAKNQLTPPPILGIQGRSKSSVLVPSEGSSAVLVMISTKSVSISNRSHDIGVNSGKITISYKVPLFDALVRGKSRYPAPAAPNLVTKKLEALHYHAVKTRSL